MQNSQHLQVFPVCRAELFSQWIVGVNLKLVGQQICHIHRACTIQTCLTDAGWMMMMSDSLHYHVVDTPKPQQVGSDLGVGYTQQFFLCFGLCRALVVHLCHHGTEHIRHGARQHQLTHIVEQPGDECRFTKLPGREQARRR